METSEIVALAVAGVLLVSLCCCCAFGSRGGRSPKEQRSSQAAQSRVSRCFRLTTYVPVLVLFRRASSVLDPCGLSSRRHLNKNSVRVISTASALRSDRVLNQLRKLFMTSGSAPAPSFTQLDLRDLAQRGNAASVAFAPRALWV